MINSPSPVRRPVPRGLHVLAIIIAAWTLLLLVVGQLVTTFRAGMADPVWPTEPWYLLSNYKVDFGYLIEHSHRIVGWVLGLLTVLLTLGLWRTDPDRYSRWLGLTGLLVLIGAYLIFHGEMRKQVDIAHPSLPLPILYSMAGSFCFVVLLGIRGLIQGTPQSGLRLLGVLALTAVMVQGLLGGFRVRFDVWFGRDLAPIHGIFGQVVFALLVVLATLTAPDRSDHPEAGRSLRRRWARYSTILFVLILLQLVWGAQVRHAPTLLMQRLHFLTAFVVFGFAAWVLHESWNSSSDRMSLGWAGRFLMVLLVLQVSLGVEAWLGKFGTGIPPELEVLTAKDLGKAIIRTLHSLIGSGLLALAATLVVRFAWPVNLNILNRDKIDMVSLMNSDETFSPRATPILSHTGEGE